MGFIQSVPSLYLWLINGETLCFPGTQDSLPLLQHRISIWLSYMLNKSLLSCFRMRPKCDTHFHNSHLQRHGFPILVTICHLMSLLTKYQPKNLFPRLEAAQTCTDVTLKNYFDICSNTPRRVFISHFSYPFQTAVRLIAQSRKQIKAPDQHSMDEVQWFHCKTNKTVGRQWKLYFKAWR